MNWEKIDDNYERAKVIRGWLVRNVKDGAMVYIPDQMHQWKP